MNKKRPRKNTLPAGSQLVEIHIKDNGDLVVLNLNPRTRPLVESLLPDGSGPACAYCG